MWKCNSNDSVARKWWRVAFEKVGRHGVTLIFRCVSLVAVATVVVVVMIVVSSFERPLPLSLRLPPPHSSSLLKWPITFQLSFISLVWKCYLLVAFGYDPSSIASLFIVFSLVVLPSRNEWSGHRRTLPALAGRTLHPPVRVVDIVGVIDVAGSGRLFDQRRRPVSRWQALLDG